MSFSPYRRFPAHAVFLAMGLSLAACSGASSDEPKAAANNAAETISADDPEGALGEMSQGNPDATVTLIEYASVTCPHCASFHESAFPTVKENYIDTGKINFVFREFPTSPPELSIAGSMVARCAADKGGDDAYFLVIDSLFKTQRAWVLADSPRDELLKVAAQIGMDEAAFDECIRRNELLDLINENVEEGRNRYNVRSTPSFVINGQLRHFSNAEELSKALDEALAKAEADAAE